MMYSNTVEMIKQFPEDVICRSLSIHGDVVFIGGIECIIQWNVVTDAVVRLEAYSDGLILLRFFTPSFT